MDGNKLSSVELAALIVDALFQAGIIGEVDIERAIAVVAEEVDVRKAIHDY
jgi:hypothetical protein